MFGEFDVDHFEKKVPRLLTKIDSGIGPEDFKF